ncbi:hypothetical protein [Aliiruegeria sabulilitoris]|uniref:hypothetical protein n=1 Tax=Aliiruegeria sabulilitoris TaxID=1510458 RepID=UPI00083636B3|nr:hypothetical protein [Aliiruegeria sabulilitoris]NDR56194.1 hypothetical protein [Pseudoruegeria sp. M32A2M]
MKLDDMMGYVVDRLYEGLTGGTADLPLPANVQLNFTQPGIPFHESFFDFAIAGPFAGPTPATLDDFGKLVETLMGPAQNGDDDANRGDAEPSPLGMSRDKAVEEAKRMYQQHLLGCWEQWSRLVDFIPSPKPAGNDNEWGANRGEGKHKHVSVVYAQNNRRLSRTFADTLRMCEVADDQLTDDQKSLIERMRRLLSVEVEVEDFLTGEKKMETRDSPAMIAYATKKQAYEDAVIEYATKLSLANNGTSGDMIEWQQSGGIYKRRATEALRDWIANGYKNDIERAQAMISHITGRSMVLWKDNLVQGLDHVENNTTGAYGYPFYPASVIPGAFARSGGWTRFSERNLSRKMSSSSSSRSGGGSFGLSLGFVTIGGSGGGGKTEHQRDFSSSSFGMEFSYAPVEIMRPWFHPDFFLSRGWRPSAGFKREYDTNVHSDGKNPPSGALIGYPTKALFVKDLVIHSSEVVSFMKSQESHVNGGGFVGIGPFCIGGRYQQSNRSSESNFDYDGASIRIKGMQLVGFLSARIPESSNPSPDVKKWA